MIVIKKYILKRLVRTIFILFIVTFLSFGLMHLSPSDPAEIMLSSQGITVSQEVLEKTRIQMGLDRPFLVQYFNWMLDLFKGDMGISYSTGKSVTYELIEHMPYTVALTISSIALTLLVSIPLGILTAIHKNKFIDYFIRVTTFVGNSLPNFFVALILLLIFALKLRILPVLSESGMMSIVLPTLALSISMISKYIRQIRAAVIEELDKGYVTGFYSRGIKKAIIYKNVLKNIMVTVLTLLGLSIGSLLGGAVIIENIFVWPGLGSLALNAIKLKDYPLIQGYVVWMVIIFVVINFIIDLLYAVIDPRITKDRGESR